jgi:hypothetical protein
MGLDVRQSAEATGCAHPGRYFARRSVHRCSPLLDCLASFGPYGAYLLNDEAVICYQEQQSGVSQEFL